MKRYRNTSDHHDMIECQDGNWVEFSKVEQDLTTLFNILVESGIITNDVHKLNTATHINAILHSQKEST